MQGTVSRLRKRGKAREKEEVVKADKEVREAEERERKEVVVKEEQEADTKGNVGGAAKRDTNNTKENAKRMTRGTS